MEYNLTENALYIIIPVVVVITIIKVLYIKHLTKQTKEITDITPKAGPEEWKNDEWGRLFLNVIKKDKEYNDSFSDLGVFKDLNEKESFIHSQLLFLTIAEEDRKDELIKEFIGEKEENFVKEFANYWFKNADRFKQTEEFKKI